jgi:copper chaperone CopZ
MKMTLKINGMHCVSCAMNIDGNLEELDGVKVANTSYIKSETIIEYDETKVSLEKIKQIIQASL